MGGCCSLDYQFEFAVVYEDAVALGLLLVLICGEKDTVTVDLCPEPVRQTFWELQELEGDNVILSVEPGTSILKQVWLLDLAL